MIGAFKMTAPKIAASKIKLLCNLASMATSTRNAQPTPPAQYAVFMGIFQRGASNSSLT
jgi:hypothetical protein